MQTEFTINTKNLTCTAESLIAYHAKHTHIKKHQPIMPNSELENKGKGKGPSEGIYQSVTSLKDIIHSSAGRQIFQIRLNTIGHPSRMDICLGHALDDGLGC